MAGSRKGPGEVPLSRRKDLVFVALIAVPITAIAAAALPATGTVSLPSFHQHGSAALAGAATPTVNCPTVQDKLPTIPATAAAEVQRNLALLQKQIDEANQRLATTVGQGGPNFIQNAILGPLKDKRASTLDRIAIAIGRTAAKPTNLGTLAACTLNGANSGGGAGASASASGSASASPTASSTGSASFTQGPSANEFIDIRQVQPNAKRVQNGANASKGSFVAKCGTNANKHNNPDNHIVAPGVSNGAHHEHDYVGNLTTNGFSTDQTLLAGGTTCQGGKDKSAYFWPVLRIRTGANTPAAGTDGADNNIGTILRPVSAKLQFRGNAQSKVVPPPQFLRIITGDAKAATNGPVNARAQWTCTGFMNRITTDHYPVCPNGSNVVRILDFPSCWDGVNLDSANHRTHVVFADSNTGACPANTKAIPQLHEVLTYAVPQAQARNIALDSFPEQLHNPVTDHADFEDVFTGNLAQQVANCINTGRRC